MWRYRALSSYSQGELSHFGIKGQKWGVRRFQNEDGSLTDEGKRRYLQSFDKQIDIYNEAADRQNRDLERINKKYEDIDLNEDDRRNLEYTKEMRDAWIKNYYDVLAEDIGSDPDTLKGQEWVDEMGFGHKFLTDMFDEEISELEKKIKDQESNNKSKSGANAASTANKKEPYSDKYANKQMTSEKAIKTAYDDLEKMYPNFNDLPLEKQDELFFDYLNESGLSRWI